MSRASRAPQFLIPGSQPGEFPHSAAGPGSDDSDRDSTASGRRRFRFLSEIAEGADGKVFMAEQLNAEGFSRVVAIKLLHARWSRDDEVAVRARDEARLLGRLHHENIVQVEDLTTIDGKAAIVMEYLEGCDLKSLWHHLRARRERFPLRALFEIGSAVASALHAAFTAVPLQGGQPLEAIHRDIKPSNLFVTTNGVVKLLDFGTARARFAGREAKTKTRALGSSGYVAPERVLGHADTPAGDIFSLGVTLHEMLSLEMFGMIPPRPHKFGSKVDEHVRELDLPGDPAYAERVRALLRAMLSFDPGQRPAAAELVGEFERLAEADPGADLRRFSRTAVAEVSAVARRASTVPDPILGETHAEEDPSGPPAARGLWPLPVEVARQSPRSLAASAAPSLHADTAVAPFDVPRFLVGVLLGSLLLVSALGVVVGLAALAMLIGMRIS